MLCQYSLCKKLIKGFLLQNVQDDEEKQIETQVNKVG